MFKLRVHNSLDEAKPDLWVLASAITVVTVDTDGDTTIYVGEHSFTVEEPAYEVLRLRNEALTSGAK